MAIASQRISNFKAWVKRKIVGFFVGIKNRLLGLVRGNSNAANSNDIELTGEEKDFQVINIEEVTCGILQFSCYF